MQRIYNSFRPRRGWVSERALRPACMAFIIVYSSLAHNNKAGLWMCHGCECLHAKWSDTFNIHIFIVFSVSRNFKQNIFEMAYTWALNGLVSGLHSYCCEWKKKIPYKCKRWKNGKLNRTKKYAETILLHTTDSSTSTGVKKWLTRCLCISQSTKYPTRTH